MRHDYYRDCIETTLTFIENTHLLLVEEQYTA